MIGRTNSLPGGGIPIGGIILWSGTANEIPKGWHLCDGEQGTPDLRNRFIVGAGDSYQIGDIGGSDAVTLTTAQMPSHNHGVGYTTIDVEDGSRVYASNLRVTKTSSDTSSAGGGQAHENRPPYYALCYIMKI